MSKIGKIVSLEKNSKTLSPITDAQFVQYKNNDLTINIGGNNVPCVNAKEGLDALTTLVKEDKTFEVVFTNIVSSITIDRDNYTYELSDGTENLNDVTYYGWDPNDPEGETIYTTTMTPAVSARVYDATFNEISFVTSVNETYHASKTYTQINTAINQGKFIIGKCMGMFDDNIVLNNYSVGGDAIYIMGIDIQDESVIGFEIDSQNNVTKLVSFIPSYDITNYYTKAESDAKFSDKMLVVEVDNNLDITNGITYSQIANALTDGVTVVYKKYSGSGINYTYSYYFVDKLIFETNQQYISSSRYDIVDGNVILSQLFHEKPDPQDEGIFEVITEDTTTVMTGGCDITLLTDNENLVENNGEYYCSKSQFAPISAEYEKRMPKYYISKIGNKGLKTYIEVNSVESIGYGDNERLTILKWMEIANNGSLTTHVLTIYPSTTIMVDGSPQDYCKVTHIENTL